MVHAKGIYRPHRPARISSGGVHHSAMVGPDGKEMWGKMVYREIVAPERLVYINSFSDAAGGNTRHPLSATWPLEMLSTFTLTESAGKTTLGLTWTPHNATAEEIATFEERTPGCSRMDRHAGSACGIPRAKIR